MKTVKFVSYGEAISDFKVEERVNHFIKSDSELWNVSNNMVIDCFRSKIHQNEIKVNDYEFFVENLSGDITPFNIDENGRTSDWVDSQDIWQNFITKLLYAKPKT